MSADPSTGSSADAPAARSRFAGVPITDDDATIAAALEDVSVPTLLLSLVHLTGDASLLDGPLRPAGIYLNEVQGFMSPDDQAAARALALDAIVAYRDGGCVLPPPPSAETIHKMMEFLVVGEVAAEYVPLILEELELDGADQRDEGWGSAIPDDIKADAHVVVVGAGMSGILAGIRLGHAGVPYTIVEKNPGAGGTWFENRYPGCRVDVGNHFYCYSFAPNDEWTEFFARQPELQRYFEDTARAYGVVEHIRFGTEVEAATWDDNTAMWTVSLSSGDRLDATAVISAVGQLNRPQLPDIAGRDSFVGRDGRGTAMHSAAWHDDIDLRGKCVAVIGTGASAFQIVPTIAGEVEHLSVYQRTAPWMFPNPNYHEPVGRGVAWALQHLPFYGRWYRFLLFWPACDGGLPAMRIDPDYPHQDRAISEINDAARDFFTQWMVEQVADDPDLARKIVPDYVCLGKRTLQDNGSWLAALNSPNVDLVTDPIDHISSTGVVTTVDGAADERPFDVIIYATGFAANKYLWPMEIRGRDGVLLSEQWGDEPTAHLGITVPNFPNLFCMYGPGTNLAHGGSLIFHSECQIRYIMGCLTQVLGGGHRSIEVTAEAHDAYNDRLQAELDTMIWGHPSIRHSWYRNGAGKIFILSPWRLVDYWTWTREPDPTDYVLR